MQQVDGRLVYSATDLVAYLECTHLAGLERAAVRGHLTRPVRSDPVLDRIAQRGIEHERRFLESLQAEGVPVVEVGRDEDLPAGEGLRRGRDATLGAMRDGAAVIYQAILFDGRRLGYADFLRRVEQPSDLGEWSYEVWDTKLARHATASAVLQLCMYSDLVGSLQGRVPAQMHLALGGVRRERVSYRVADYAAYYRLVARDFEAFLADGPAFPVGSDPEPVEHCDVCRWSEHCRRQWRAGDDLSLVAGLSSRQRRALHAVDVTTRGGLAEPPAPLPDRLEGAGREALARIQAQAQIQVRGERAGEMLSARIAPPRDREGRLVADQGLLMLPEPSPGDLFFDIEGDPFFGSDEVDGIDYLFGVVEPGRPDASGRPAFHAFWSIEQGTVTPAAERRAFEAFIDLVTDRLASDPKLHIYHYAPYEPTAVKRLAGRYATREEEVDRLLRGEVFVDLYRAVRQGIRASVESYSLKRLEPLYGFRREVELRDAGDSIVEFETWLELGQGEERSGLLDAIELYNRDDCLSTWRLRDWLEDERAELARGLGALPRPAVPEPEEREDSAAQQAVNELAAALLEGLPESVERMDGDERGRWLLAQLLNWHRREEKSLWWRYFYLVNELTDEERREESDALGELTHERSWRDPTPRSRSTIHRFRFPPQDHSLRVGSSPRDPATGGSTGTVVHLDDDEGVIDIKRGRSAPPTCTSLVPLDRVPPGPKPESLQRLARRVLGHGIAGAGPFRAARDLLARRPPRLGQPAGAQLRHEGEPAADAARRLVGTLDGSYLAIQGPPGSGKSTVGAEMIVGLVEEGLRVGVTANSHKVIGELLAKVARVADERDVFVEIGQRSREEPTYGGALHLESNGEARDELAAGNLAVVGGTTWLWARADMAGSVDVLFIDEAGQMSLADALAASPAASSVVLLGDPQQLDQPLQGVHPPGAGGSVLAHVLDGERVMPGHLGLFLDGSWRLHPAISAYTSEVFYEGRLRSHPGRERLDLDGVEPLSGTGIRFVPVSHSGRSNESVEEAGAVATLVGAVLRGGTEYTDAAGAPHPLGESDVLVITPYNAQVGAIRDALPGVRVGTVDKFQGQEAPIAIYSMATSSGAEAPRGMEFLYSLNRLNVATSRAQCLAVVVASPALVRVRCRTPRQMRLANALARLIEVAGERGESERP
ncbi:MAG: TM0106 family RecB-like putative nuclease [Chloroflexi bacterium]|nr:TM0106 family RecB-like putative nuclease [Chloroflexota bacterium]